MNVSTYYKHKARLAKDGHSFQNAIDLMRIKDEYGGDYGDLGQDSIQYACEQLINSIFMRQ